MKLCQTCNQPLAEPITTCPSCGARVQKGREYISKYRILDVVHEGHASILCRAEKPDSSGPVLIRLYKEQSRVDETVVERLRARLEQISSLPDDQFVQHYEISCTADGLWYRVSEWVEGESWSRILAGEAIKDTDIVFELFYKIASCLSTLHDTGHFMPHIVLSDIIAFKNRTGGLEVKIDYKLSRFLDRDETTLPGTLLDSLLKCHPDMVNRRPLDYRSDVWSLGKIFLELLTAELDGCPTAVGIEKLPIPKDGKMLLKTMLAEDPTVRPQSMQEVVESISHVLERKSERKRKRRFAGVSSSLKEFKRLRLRLRILAASMVLLFGAGIVSIALFYSGLITSDAEFAFQQYANRYSDSVAFVLVEFTLRDGDTLLYQKRVEGTAFLVDESGYMLTNRHVVCPWLQDRDLYAIIKNMKELTPQMRFEHRMFLWFEGQRAYKRLPDIDANSALSDVYFLESAYSSMGKPSVSIAGIARAPSSTVTHYLSVLEDDFAVLKINKVPKGLEPLPLAKSLDVKSIPKLSPVITIGFPLGSRTQADRVNVSVTKGNVRRTFNNIIQVDTSIYRGNSGGPIINEQGQVIGIATAVAFDQATSVVPVLTPLSDIGIVLPITKTVTFLRDLKSGREKWNGILDLSQEDRIEQVRRLAFEGKWDQARKLIDYQLRISRSPALFKAAGMIHFCVGEINEARQFFKRVLWMNSEDHSVQLMLYLIDWIEGRLQHNADYQSLMDLNWRSDGEFFGYLSRVLSGRVDPAAAINAWSSEAEKSWLYYVIGLINQKYGTGRKPGELFEKAAEAADKDNWVLYLALSQLDQIRQHQIALSGSKRAASRIRKATDNMHKRILSTQKVRAARFEQLDPLISRLLQPAVRIADKRELLARMVEIDQTNRENIVGLAFITAMMEDWDTALAYIDKYQLVNDRESRSYLGLKLLEIGISHKTGSSPQVVREKLSRFSQTVQDGWYRRVAKSMASPQLRMALVEYALSSPEHLIVAHHAWGFWAEGEQDPETAIKHYQEVLGTYLYRWWEYAFARERIRVLRKSP